MKPLESSENPLLKKLFYLLFILVVTFIVYAPARNAKLTSWDDDKYITNNIDITSFKKYKANLLTKSYESNYHPLTMLSYAFDYSTGKLNPKVYHRTNIILHLINSVLVFWFILLLLKNPEMAFICGMLFGIHPLQVESVAWVSERKNVLYTLFFLSSLIAYIKYLKKAQLKFYFFALFLFILSLLSKGMAVSLSITLIAIDYLSGRELLSRKVLLEKIPFFALSVLFGIIAVLMQPLELEKVDPFRAAPLQNPLYEKFIYATYNIGQYIFKLFIPLKLAMFYPYPEKENGGLPLQYYIVPGMILVFLSTSFIFLIKSKKHSSRLILFCGLFFLVNIALVLQLLPVGDAITADRYAYIPSIGIFLLISLVYKYITENQVKIRGVFIALLTTYCFWLSYLAYERCKVWHDSLSLWSDEIEKYPHLSFAYYNRGSVKQDENDLKGAIEDYTKGIQLNPFYYLTYNNRGVAESINGNYQAAISDFDKALSLNKKYADAYKNRGRIKYKAGDYKGAVQDYSSYIKFKPQDYEVYVMRGLAKFYLKDYANAISDYDKAIELVPEYTEAYCNRGVAKSISNDLKGAMSDLNKAIEISPYYNAAYYNRAKVKFLMGLSEEVCADLQKAATYGHAEAGKEVSQFCK